MVIIIVIGALGTIPKVLEKRMVELEIGGRIENIQTKAFFFMGQSTKKRSRDLERLAVTQTPVKDPQLTLV